MELTILQWIFQGIPECLALASLAVVLAGRGLEVKSVLLIGLPYAAAAYLIRLLPLSFGIHFIIFIVLLAALLNVLLKINFIRSLLTALVAAIILAAAEVACINLIISVTGIPFEEVRENLLIVYGWPHTVVLFLLALAVNRWGKSLRLKKEGYDA